MLSSSGFKMWTFEVTVSLRLQCVRIFKPAYIRCGKSIPEGNNDLWAVLSAGSGVNFWKKGGSGKRAGVDF